MKRLILALALLLGLALPANAAITRGVGPVYGTDITGLNSNVATTLNSTTIGRSLVIVVMWYDPSANITISSITISGESDATLIAGSKLTNGVAAISMQIAYLANNTAGGNKLVTVNFSATTYTDMAVTEYAGMDTASQPDSSATATGLTTATTSYATTTANALIVAASINNSAEFTAGSGYTLFGNGGIPNSMFYEEAEDILDAGASGGGKTVDFTGFAANWDMSIASFKAASVVATPIRRRVTNQ